MINDDLMMDYDEVIFTIKVHHLIILIIVQTLQQGYTPSREP